MVAPWSLCLVFYSVLHFTYGGDRARARAWAAAAPPSSYQLVH